MPAAADGYRRTLLEQGYSADLAGNAVEAVTAAQLAVYPVVVLVQQGSGVDWFTLVQRVGCALADSSFVLIERAWGDGAVSGDLGQLHVAARVTEDCGRAEVVSAVEAGFADYDARAAGMVLDGLQGTDAALTWLVLADDPSDAEQIRKHLHELYGAVQARCLFAGRLSEAESALLDEPISLIFCDLSLPASGGLDTVKRLREVAPTVALVVLTGADDDLMSRRAIELGAQDYLVKDEINDRLMRRTIRYAFERMRVTQRISQIAYYDSLTGLANRVAFNERLAQLYERGRRNGEALRMLFVDLDHFKSINDTFGHDAGDSVLVQVATRLTCVTRPYDTVARLGGDEFAILFDDGAGDADPEKISQRILEELRQPVVAAGIELALTASIGIAECKPGEASVTELLRMADAAMYEAKAGGRNRYQYARSGVVASMPVQRVHSEIRRAVSANEFYLNYQPQLSLGAGRVVGAEALLRWRKPDGTAGRPDEFIPHLEELGLICDVGRWVLKTACAQMAVIDPSGGAGLRVAVNLSARQIMKGLQDVVQEALECSGLPPNRLELEVTESLLMQDTAATQDVLTGLRKLGGRGAIDGFGTGYSSLAYLQRFEVDCLKLDKSFVQSLAKGSRSEIMISAIIELAHRLGMEVVAEGVETWRQLDFLRSEGCNIGQGYLFAKPAEIGQCLQFPMSATALRC